MNKQPIPNTSKLSLSAFLDHPSRAFPPELERSYLEYQNPRNLRYSLTVSIYALGIGYPLTFIYWYIANPPVAVIVTLLTLLTLTLIATLAAFKWQRVFFSHWTMVPIFAMAAIGILLVLEFSPPERHKFNFGIAFLPLIIMPVLRASIMPSVLLIALYLLAFALWTIDKGHYTLPEFIVVMLPLVLAGLLGLAATAKQDSAMRREYLMHLAVQLEKQRSDRLLANVLPQSIVDRLKATEGEPRFFEHFDSVSVLFADIVGFTQLTESMPLAKTGEVLNELFTRFDMATNEFAVEKIKTIGDAYLVVSGLPTKNGNHTQQIASFALRLQEISAQFAKESGIPIQVRIGLHCGPVVAGIIGTKKFQYDVWGDTVNTAARMQTSATAGEIQLTAAFKQSLGETFELSYRGVVNAKGKGPMDAWRLVGEVSPEHTSPTSNSITQKIA